MALGSVRPTRFQSWSRMTSSTRRSVRSLASLVCARSFGSQIVTKLSGRVGNAKGAPRGAPLSETESDGVSDLRPLCWLYHDRHLRRIDSGDVLLDPEQDAVGRVCCARSAERIGRDGPTIGMVLNDAFGTVVDDGGRQCSLSVESSPEEVIQKGRTSHSRLEGCDVANLLGIRLGRLACRRGRRLAVQSDDVFRSGGHDEPSPPGRFPDAPTLYQISRPRRLRKRCRIVAIGGRPLARFAQIVMPAKFGTLFIRLLVQIQNQICRASDLYTAHFYLSGCSTPARGSTVATVPR